MVSFKEANQVRLSLKMRLSNYSWYKYSSVMPNKDSYHVIVTVSNINNEIRKVIPPVINGISVKTELE